MMWETGKCGEIEMHFAVFLLSVFFHLVGLADDVG
jgi:hypothetical protein